MRTLLCLFILLKTFYITCQVKFLPHKNAEWHYRFNSTAGPSVYNETLKYVNDSIIGTDTIKVLHHTRHFSTCEAPISQMTFFKQKNDSVFFKSPITFNQWQLLINYNALPGQSWNFTIKNNDNTPQTYTVAVNSVSTAMVNGFSLKVLGVFYNAQFSTGNSNIYERFGDTQFLFNFADKFSAMATCTIAAGILCYQDSTFGLKQFTADPCTYSTTSLNEMSEDTRNLPFYPNSTSGILHSNFYGTVQAEEIKIINIVGQEVYFTRNEDIIDISGLQAGVYLLQVYPNKKAQATYKIVKE